MIELLIESYLNLILLIGGGSLLLFLIGLYWILKPRRITAAKIISLKEQKQEEAHAKHISAIAGDDVMSTQLDLARAFIETGKTHSAKDILDVVIANGSGSQRLEAQRLQQHL